MVPQGVGTIIHCEVQNMIYPVTLDTLYQVRAFCWLVVRESGSAAKGDCVCGCVAWAHLAFVSVA